MKLKPALITLAKILISILILWIIFSKVQFEQLRDSFYDISYLAVLSAILVGFLDRLLQSYKWTFLINSYGFKVNYSDALKTDMMGNFSGQFLPAGVGGDIVRIFLFKKIGIPLLETTASVFVERLLGVFSLITCTLIAVLFCLLLDVEVPPTVLQMTVILFFFVLLFILLSFSRLFSAISTSTLKFIAVKFGSKYSGVIEKVTAILEAYIHFAGNKKTLLFYFLLSLLEVLAVCCVFFVTSKALPIGITLLQMVLIVPPIQLLQRIPISLNGIGIQEGLLVYFFINFQVPIQTALVFGILIRLVGIIILIPGGILLLQQKKADAAVN